MLKIPALYLCLLISGSAWALGPPAAMTEAEFDALMQQISNWNRWGADDELGTLNLITPRERRAAAGPL